MPTSNTPLPADPCDAFLTFLWEEITARDWGDEKLGEAMGVTTGEAYALLSGQLVPTQDTYQQLGKAMGTSWELWRNLHQRSTGASNVQ